MPRQINQGGDDASVVGLVVGRPPQLRTIGQRNNHDAGVQISFNGLWPQDRMKGGPLHFMAQLGESFGPSRTHPAPTLACQRTGSGINLLAAIASVISRLRIFPLGVSGISSTSMKYSGMSYFDRPSSSRCSRTATAAIARPG